MGTFNALRYNEQEVLDGLDDHETRIGDNEAQISGTPLERQANDAIFVRGAGFVTEPRGDYALDLQATTDSNNVAAGSRSVILGGQGNNVAPNAEGGCILSGKDHEVTEPYSVALGGRNCSAGHSHAIVISGDTRGNLASSRQAGEIVLHSENGVHYSPFLYQPREPHGDVIEFTLAAWGDEENMTVFDTMEIDRLIGFTGTLHVYVNWGANDNEDYAAQQNFFALSVSIGNFETGDTGTGFKNITGNTTVTFYYNTNTTEMTTKLQSSGRQVVVPSTGASVVAAVKILAR